jgi:GT2 family glycosyltransferase
MAPPAYFAALVSPTVTAVVVSYADPLATLGAIDSLRSQSLAPVEVLVVDNDPAGSTVRALADRRISTGLRILHTGANLGYTGAANLAAREAAGEWLFFLNPDAVAEHECLERLLQAVDGPDVAIVGAQVLLPDGRVNAGDNPVNILGISWSGGYGRPREHGPARDTAAVSGAALLVRRDAFLDVGGLCPAFFMYVDDTDLAWRVRLGGRRVRYCPEAVVVHDYEFRKSSHKWFYLERNRLWALLSNLQVSTLMLLAPLLLAAEAGIFMRAISGHWLAEKLRAWSSIFGESRQLFRWRRGVQAGRVVSDYRVLRMFSATLETEPIDGGVPPWVNTGLKLYRRLLLGCLSRLEGRRAQP